MAQIEPMDVDSIESDYEDKENSILHSNVLPKIPNTEKGYEELDASELNMKLRYSITPASSPMSRSYTASCKDNKNIEDKNSGNIGNTNLTSSLNSTLTNSDINKAFKVNPLQSLPTEHLNDMNKNVLLPKSLDYEDNNVTITVSNSVDENLSIASTSSSITHTPEATTPTKELPKDGGSPIMRGLRSVLSMFKPHSPPPSHDQGLLEDSARLHSNNTIMDESQIHPVGVSTPLHITNRLSSKRTSPHKDSIIFNDGLEKELQWKDDSTILFKEEKIPKHKLLLQESVASNIESKILNNTKEECNRTLEHMDISYNDSVLDDKTMTDIETKQHTGLEAGGLESDGEFVDCETTFTKDEIESLLKSKENISMQNSIQYTLINAEAGTSNFVKDVHPLNLTIPVESSELVWCADSDVVKSEVLARAENDNIVSNNISEQALLLTPHDKSKLANNLDMNMPVESSDLLMCKVMGIAKSKDSTNAESVGSDLTNISPQNLSLTHSKDILDLQVNSDINICEEMLTNDSVSNTEFNDIIITNESSVENVTDTVQHKENEKKHVTLVCGKNKINDDSLSQIENEMESKENCIDKIDVLVIDEEGKSAVYVNSITNDIDPTLLQIGNQIPYNETNRETVFEGIDSNIEKIYENNKEIADSSIQTINDGCKTLEIKVDNKLPLEHFCEVLQNSRDNHENAKSLNEKVKSIAVEKETEIVIPEINEMLPVNVPLPTDSEFEKEIVTVCNENQISDEMGVNEISDEVKVNENSDSFEMDADKVLDKLPCLMGTLPIEKVGDETINQRINSSNCEPDSTFDNVDEKCVAGNMTFDNNTLFKIIENVHEISEPIVPTCKEDQTNNITVLIKSNADDIIDEKPVNYCDDALQPTHDETVQLLVNEVSKSELSSPCGTNSNFENIDVEYSNTEQLSNLFETKNKIQKSPPLSPVISSKGYNINFDDIDDPFATKTKIRQSPTPDASSHVSSVSEDIKSQKASPKLKKSEKRKSYPIKKPMNAKKNSLNATFECDNKNESKANIKNSEVRAINTREEESFDTFKVDANGLTNTINESTSKHDFEIENKTISLIDNNSDEIKKEHSFLKPTDPSPVRDMTKSIFNCPEINDLNFSSFSDKEKKLALNLTMPSDDIILDNKDCPRPKIDSLDSVCPEDINNQEVTPVETSLLYKDSKNSDTKEVNTEDEDTATFNETIEFIENDKENPNTEKDLLGFEVSHRALENENVDNGEMFIDAEAFEFLLNQNQSNVIADSGKESLFLKFDPLFTKRVSSDGLLAALKKVQNNQSTPKKLTKLQLQTPFEMPGPSQKESADDVIDDASIQAMTKPMMVVNPAVNSIVSPRKAATPKVNRQSLTFTSPAMAVIDKLLSLSGSSLVAEHNTPVSSPARQHNETDIALTQLREMLADKDIHVHNLRSESKVLKERLSNLEAQVKSLEVESAERLKKVNDLNERLLEKTKINKSMSNVVEEYERTIASLIAQIEQEKKNNAEEKLMLIKERDEQTAHLASMEVSFNDLHSKYEKSKQLIYSMKANEEIYKKSLKEFEESLTKMQNNYELLKQHATSKLNHANLELEKFNRAHESEVLKLNALIKRKELHITSLEETLAQKTKANEELAAICDELINKVG